MRSSASTPQRCTSRARSGIRACSGCCRIGQAGAGLRDGTKTSRCADRANPAIGRAPLRKFTSRELGAQPLLGPFSRYLNQHETAILVALVKSVAPKVMIEFGCNAGLTAKCVLQNVRTLERYIGIDVPPDHVPTLDCQQSE